MWPDSHSTIVWYDKPVPQYVLTGSVRGLKISA